MGYLFNLQKVLDYRVKSEEEQNRRLAHTFREMELTKLELSRLRKVLESLHDEDSSRRTELVDIPATLLACDYVAYLSSVVKEQEHALFRCEERLAEQIRLTEQAMKERKAMDTLRDRDLSKYHHELNVAEQRVSDEIARMNFLQQRHPDRQG